MSTPYDLPTDMDALFAVDERDFPQPPAPPESPARREQHTNTTTVPVSPGDDELVGSELRLSQWLDYERRIFNDNNPPVQYGQIMDIARYCMVNPISLLTVMAQRALCCMPAGTDQKVLNSPGSVNTLVAIAGHPGTGKGVTINAAANNLTVWADLEQHRKIELQVSPLGSGEGIAAALQPVQDSEHAAPSPHEPLLFCTTEVTELGTLMGRTGSTLRSTLLKLYSGEALGARNKNEVVNVSPMSYTTGVLIGVQPDTAGVILGGDDNGMADRFIWTEAVAPTQPDEHILTTPPSLEVFTPTGIGQGFTFPTDIRREVWDNLREVRSGRVRARGGGHRDQTRVKLACGLALLRSEREVSHDDWHRAGLIIEVSELIARRYVQHQRNRLVEALAEKHDRDDEAKTLRYRQHVVKQVNRIVDALRDSDNVAKSSLYNNVGRYRQAFNTALETLEIHEVVVVTGRDSQGNGGYLSPGAGYSQSVIDQIKTEYMNDH